MLDLTDRNGKKDIKSMTLEEVTAELGTLGEKPFRAKQLYDWLHVKLVTDFDQMSTLSKSLRERLKEHYSVTALKVVGERISAVDGTRKYLFGRWECDLECVDEVPSRQFRMHFLPGGLPYGLPLLRLHPGRSGAEPAGLRNAGSDLSDPDHYRRAGIQCGDHGFRRTHGQL